MNLPRLLLLAACGLASAFGQYVYDYPSLLNPYNSSQWTPSGTISASTNMVTSASSGSLMFIPTLPAPSKAYDVKTTLALPSSGGTYTTHLRGGSVEVELINPTYSGSVCTATLEVIRGIGGSPWFYAQGIPCHNGMVIRSVMKTGGQMMVYIDNIQYAHVDTGVLAAGQPGVGVASAPSGNGITAIAIGHFDTVAPNAITSVTGSGFRGRVDLQWPATTDDTNGTGVYQYVVSRNSTVLGQTTSTSFQDYTAGLSGTYTYTVQAVDYHDNSATTSASITASANPDPRETGVRPLGTYWGGAGEQVDMRSGNLNFTLPVLRAMSRIGKGATFQLGYNSQNWRQDAAGTWQIGGDVGLGYGWRLQAGSLTPLYSGAWSLAGYLFIDSTGAEYLLTTHNVDSVGGWTSQEGIYLDKATDLNFPDGSRWKFACTSAATEADAGTSYPTRMVDSNGNRVMIHYYPGVGLGDNDSSSRLKNIEDVRGNGIVDYTFAYTLLNPTDRFPHLTGITNSIGTAENYSFSYASAPLNSPFNGSSFGTFPFLQSMTQTGIPLTTSFTYDSSGTGELDQVTTPYGGHLRWTYAAITLAGGVTYREVQNRYLSMSNGATETSVQLVRGNDSAYYVHSTATLDDSTSNAEKFWTFRTDPAQFDVGLQLTYEERSLPSHTALQHLDFTWAQTASSNNPYIGTTLTTLDPGQSYQAQKKTTQTVDTWGNVTQMQVFNFGNLVTPARTYTNTYQTKRGNLSSGTFYSIYNLLLTSTVTDGTNLATLVSNSYDGTTITSLTGVNEHDDMDYPTTFTSRGNVTGSTTPTSSTTNYYDMAGNLIYTTVNGVSTAVSLTSATNYAAASQTTTNSLSATVNWNGFLGLSSATGPNGDNGSIGYDANARPQTQTSTYGAVTTFTYNDSASPPNNIATTCPTSTLCNGHWNQSTMDGFGRTIQGKTGYGSTTVSIADTVYAPGGCSWLGKLSKVSAAYAPGGSDAWTTYAYDASGRTLNVTLPDGSATTYIYQGNTVKSIDAAGHWKTFTIDAIGKMSSVLEPDPTLGNVTTSYTYDILNHLTNVSMPRGSNTQVRSFNYTTGTTVGGLLLSTTNPETGTVSYGYNANNLVASTTDAKGQNFSYQYDTYNRLASIKWTNAPGGSKTLRTYMYDLNTLSSFSGTNTKGRLVAVQNSQFQPGASTSPSAIAFTEMYAYTQQGEITGKRLHVDETVSTGTLTSNLDSTYTYNSEGKMTSVRYPATTAGAGPVYTNSFDSLSRLSGLTDQGSNTDVSGVSYNAAYQLSGINYLGATETRQYNSMTQLTQLAATGTSSISYTYNYPAGANNGQISSQIVSGETINYQYDSLSRLIQATSNAGWGENYGYDAFGNLLSKAPTGGAPTLSQAVNPANNQIVGQTYDANGNQLTAPAGGSLTYDSENRLMTAPGLQYAYDSKNKRVWTGTLDGSGNLTAQQLFFYGADGQMLGRYSITVGSSSLTVATMNLSVYFGSKRIGLTNSSGVTTAFSPDRLGSAGQYYPYGEGKGGNNPADTWSFATYWRDSTTGLDYADQRYYSNQSGRFLTPDTDPGSAKSSNPQSWGRYAYVGGDPVNGSDPSGLNGCTPGNIYEDAFFSEFGDDFIGGCNKAGGGVCNAESASCGGPCVAPDGFAPRPGPFCQGGGEPAPQPPRPPILIPPPSNPAPPLPPAPTCRFMYANILPVQKIDSSAGVGWYIPMTFNFMTNPQTSVWWSNYQGVDETQKGTYANGTPFSGTDSSPELLSFADSANPLNVKSTSYGWSGLIAHVLDAPGLTEAQDEPLLSATNTWTAQLNVFVSNGYQTIACPVVNWTATETYSNSTGTPIVTGGGTASVTP